MKTKVAIIGATGYTGLELVKILVRHKQVQLSHLAVRRTPMPKYSEIFPELTKICDMQCSEIDADKICKDSDVIFFALPHKVTMTLMPSFLNKGKKIIDLSSDYRLKDVSTYEKAYGQKHEDATHVKDFVYGLPEVTKENIKKSQNIANPGCFPTSILLALYPLLKNKCINLEGIIADSKTGVSGGGREPKPDFHFPECNESVKPYRVGVHQHEPEIEQELGNMAGKNVDIIFVPHLISMTRGILSTVYADLKKEYSWQEIEALYKACYSNEPFVRLKAEGQYPQTKDTTNTNFCDIGFKIIGKKIVVMSAIDNLVKGASGQAVQNMNIMCGFDEREGIL